MIQSSEGSTQTLAVGLKRQPQETTVDDVDNGAILKMREATEAIAWLKCDTATCTWQEPIFID